MPETIGPTTPESLVESAYATFPRRIAIARERLGRPMTFAEKVLAAHADDPWGVGSTRGVDYADYRPDRVAMQDATAFVQSRCGKRIWRVIHAGHLFAQDRDGIVFGFA